MSNLTELTVTCDKCDTAFSAKYSPYSPTKTVRCPSCGADLPLPVSPPAPSAPTDPQATVAYTQAAAGLKPWAVENRYVLAGTTCLILAAAFMSISLGTFQVYLPLAGLALVFGVLAVVDRKLVQGLALIICTAVIGSLLHGFLLDLRHGDELRGFENSLRELQDLPSKPDSRPRR